MKDNLPSYLCVDASNVLHMNFHGIPAMQSPNTGLFTHALYGWIHFLMLARKRMPYLPEDVRIVVFFDSKLERSDAQQEGSIPLNYKGNRKETAPSLRSQISMAEILTDLMGFAHVKEPGMEADTLMGSFVLNERERSNQIYIRSSDKDMRQLVCDNVFMISQVKSEMIVEDAEFVKNKHGVNPEQIADLLVLQGDASDNIPGIPGIGPVTAVKLLKQYGSLDGILAHKAEITGKPGKSLSENIGAIPQLRRLVTFEKGEVRVKQSPPQMEQVKQWLAYLEMHKTLKLFP